MPVAASPEKRHRPETRAVSLAVQILTRLFGDPPRDCAFRLWDGTEIRAAGTPRCTMVITHPGALRRMFLPPSDLTIGEAFLRGDFDADGDLEAAIGLAEAAAGRLAGRDRLQLARLLAALPRAEDAAPLRRRAALAGPRHSLARDRQAIAHHYVEGLREHYARTLRHWVRRLEARRDEAIRIAGEEVYRTWRLFMSGSAYGFATGCLGVYQALLARPDATGRVEAPMTRRAWYRL